MQFLYCLENVKDLHLSICCSGTFSVCIGLSVFCIWQQVTRTFPPEESMTHTLVITACVELRLLPASSWRKVTFFAWPVKLSAWGLLTQIVILIMPVKAEIVKGSFIVRLHRGLSNSKETVLAYTECWVVEKVKLQPQEQAKSQDQWELDYSFQLEGFIG